MKRHLTLAAFFALSLSFVAHADAPPATEEPLPTPGPTLSSDFTTTAVLRDASGDKTAFTLQGHATVVQNGFKSTITIAGKTIPCDATAQLSDKDSKVTQYFCLLDPPTLFTLLQANPNIAPLWMESSVLLKGYYAANPLGMFEILIGHDSANVATTSFAETYADPNVKTQSLRVDETASRVSAPPSSVR